MPYKSAKQRGYLHAHPEITDKKGRPVAAKWDAEIHAAKKRVKKNHGEGWLKPVIAGTVAGGLANQFPRVQDIEREHRKKKRGAASKAKIRKAYTQYVHSDDPDFNHVAAQRAFDLVMKMDDDTAEMFTHIVVSELFTDDIEKNLGTLQRHLDEVIAKRLTDLKQAHLRLVSKGMDPEQAVAYAQAIALVSKAVDPEDWEEKLHPRGTGGRFRTKITHNQTKEIHPKTAETLGIAAVPESLKGKDRAKFQDEYRQLADFLSSVSHSTGGGGNHEVHLHFRDKGQREFTSRHSGTVPPTEQLADPNLTLIGAEAHPTTLTAGGAAFGLSGALGHPLTSSQVAGISAASTAGGGFVDQWTNAGDPANSNAKLYGRTAAAGQFMGAVGPPGSKTQLAGKFAEIIGSAGPQAENVLGPTARKTAYRYRGTEKTPDAELVGEYRKAVIRQMADRTGFADENTEKTVKTAQTRALRAEQGRLAEAQGKPIESIRIPNERRVQIMNDAQKTVRRLQSGKPTWEDRETGRRAVLEHLRESLPNQQLYALQLASGNTPPSEGVIINANGQLAAQAVGYADDHYLPFNLKNLKGLKGGEYIRTRSVGGLTAEDVYTGLISGARQVTVTSRSGTFTMTFADDFRGGRRHSDKARRMTRRYEQLLDAVQSGQVERAQIPPEIKQTIASQVREEYAGQGNVTIRNITKDREKEYRDNPELSDVDEQAARHLAIARFDDENSPDAKAFIRQRLNDLQRKKQVNWQLNGDGYAAALSGLEEQFPYYIKTDSHVLDDEDKASLERDKGYVEPGRNRPTAAQGIGLYGTTINPGLKREGLGAATASRADYQRGRFDQRSTAPKKGPDGEPKKEEGKDGKAGEAGEKDAKKFSRQVAQDIKHRTYSDAIFDGMQGQGSGPKVKAAFPWLNDRDEYNRMHEGPEGPAEMEKLVAAITPNLTAFPPEVQNAVRGWNHSGVPVSDEAFVPGRWPASPAPFPGTPYKKGGDAQAKWVEFKRLNTVYGRSLKFGQNIGMLSDSQLKQEHDALVGVLSAIRRNPELVQATNEAGADVRTDLAAAFYDSAAPDTVAILMKSPEQIEQKMKTLQQLRSLKASGLDTTVRNEVRPDNMPGIRSPELNVAKPPAQIFADQGADIVDAEVVDEPEPVREPDPAERAKMMRLQTQHLVNAAKNKLAQKPESGWTANEYDLQNAIDDYEIDPPTEPAEIDAVHQHLYDLHRQSF